MKEGDLICPRCGSTKISPILYAVPEVKPAEDNDKKSEKIHTKLGYMYSLDHPPWHCNNCGYEW